MQIYDISLPISPALPVWPGDPPIQIKRIAKIEDGAIANLTMLNMTAHVGTHIDAPYHFMGDRYPTVDTLNLNILTGRVYVLQIPEEVDVISAAVLEAAMIPPRTRRLLLKTRNSKMWLQHGADFCTNYVGISQDGAQYLVEKGIRLVGIDYLSIGPYQEDIPTHQILLKAGVVVVEGLNLNDVSPGRYALYCLPLKLLGADGAPARAILIGV